MHGDAADAELVDAVAQDVGIADGGHAVHGAAGCQHDHQIRADAGRHGKGAAAYALKRYEACQGQGEGHQGFAYGVPTKGQDLTPLHLDEVAVHVERFFAEARMNLAREYMVTRVGCGLSGFHDRDIAPLFKDAPPNVYLPGRWERIRTPGFAPRVIVAGSREIADRSLIFDTLDHTLAKLDAPVIVSGGARGVDLIGEEYALERGLAIERFPAWWRTEGRPAGTMRNRRMAWRGTHLVAFWDGKSPGTRGMLEIAKQEGLKMRLNKG